MLTRLQHFAAQWAPLVGLGYTTVVVLKWLLRHSWRISRALSAKLKGLRRVHAQKARSLHPERGLGWSAAKMRHEYHAMGQGATLGSYVVAMRDGYVVSASDPTGGQWVGNYPKPSSSWHHRLLLAVTVGIAVAAFVAAYAQRG